jgi:hypothetical protein
MSVYTEDVISEAIDSLDPFIYKIMDISMETQRHKKPGHGSPICLTGPPGVGKTEFFRQFAAIKNLYFLPVILSRIPSVDIGGIYVPDIKNNELKHLITRRFLGENIPDGYDGIFILFDEVGTAMPDQQASIQSMIEDWNLEGNLIKNEVYFGFATNGAEHNCGSNDLIKSLIDRLYMHPVEVNRNGWLKWAVRSGIQSSIHSFIGWKEDGLHRFDPDAPQGGQPCPRSWAKLSYMIDAAGGDKAVDNHTRFMLAKGKVGEEIAHEYNGFSKMFDELVPVRAVFDDPENCPVPHHNTSAMFAMVGNLATVFAERKRKDEDLMEPEVTASIKYIDRMGDAMAVYGFRTLFNSNPLFATRSEEFSKFKARHKDLEI